MNNQPRILNEDDDPITRFTIEVLLAGDSYSLYFAEDGVEGIEKAASIEPDVILLDVTLPNFNGFEVLRQIRSTPWLADIPILLISTLNGRDARLTGLRVGKLDWGRK